MDDEAIVFIEWANMFAEILPGKIMKLKLSVPIILHEKYLLKRMNELFQY